MPQPRSLAVALVTLACFTDITAYSIAIPVLPDLSRKLGASPTMIGVLFASFGVTLLTVSIPMGAISDRIGRKGPMVGGLAALAAATLLFAFATSLPWLFAARLVQGAADAVTWVVGFALIADLYGAEERGRVSGIVMMGTSVAVMVGPTLGGWLYELGGISMPFIGVAALAIIVMTLFMALDFPDHQAPTEPVPLGMIVRVPAIAACAIVVIGISSTISMLEPILALYLAGLGVTPARLGLIYGAAAIVTTTMHPLVGRLSDRWGARPTMMLGLLLMAGMIAALGQAWSYMSALVLFVIAAGTGTLVITPSLAYMGEATTAAGVRSFGVSYGLYNLAWGAGLMSGPALGGFLFERLGFWRLMLLWAPMLIAVRWRLAAVRQERREGREGQERQERQEG
jgi:MFS transporter, DHA1 family, solute carrier family 18 (vesicular amine transporter), member 1/2